MVRQFIVVSVIFSIVISPFVMALLGIPTYLQVDYQDGGDILGFVAEKTKTAFVEISGNLITTEIRQCLIAITGFYFGSAAASNKS
jgi:choline-glycine betaine transporter